MEARLLSRICFIYCITWGRNSSLAYQLFVFRLSLKWELAAYLHCHSEIYPSGCLSIAGPWHFPWGGVAALQSRYTSLRQHDKSRGEVRLKPLGWRWSSRLVNLSASARDEKRWKWLWGDQRWPQSVSPHLRSSPRVLTLKPIKVARIYAHSSVWTSHVGACLAGRDGKTEFSVFSTPTCLNPTCPYRSQSLPTGLSSRPTANHSKAE